MKQRFTYTYIARPLMLLGIACLAASQCSQSQTADSSGGGAAAPPPTGGGSAANTITFALGGSARNWSAIFDADAGMYFRFGLNGALDRNHIFVLGDPAIGTFTKIGGADMQIDAGSGVQWGASCDGSNFTVNVTSVTASEVAGDFSGTLRDCAVSLGSPGDTISVTGGQFTVSR